MLVWQANAPYWDARICAVVRGRMLAWLITGECPVSGMPSDAGGGAAGCLPGRRMPHTRDAWCSMWCSQKIPGHTHGGAAGANACTGPAKGMQQAHVDAPKGCPVTHVGLRPVACIGHKPVADALMDAWSANARYLVQHTEVRPDACQ